MSVKKSISKSVSFTRKHLFLILIGVFIIWIAFISESSLIKHARLKNEVKDLQDALDYYRERTEENKQRLLIMENDTYLEKFAREKFYMKRDNEDVFVFEEETE